MSGDPVRIQKALNGFVAGWPRLGLSPVAEDGQLGPASRKLLREVRYLIGYLHDVDALPDENFYRRVVHPRQVDPAWGQTKEVVAAGKKRRGARARMVLRSKIRSYLKPGVGKFDGKPVAKVAIPILTWCRDHGWKGALNSGYRTPAYSRHLCYEICGQPTCPGRCAGTTSNHTGDTPEKFAVDVSDYTTFARVVAKCPIKPRIFNDLPSDPVHFSPTGH